MKDWDIIRFGDFELDADRRHLASLLTGESVALNSRAFDLLLFLARHPGVLISRNEIMAAVWPDVVVEDNSVSKCISLLRRSLREQPGENKYIVTEPGRGFRFQASAIRSGVSRQIPPLETHNVHAYQLYVSGWNALTRPGSENLEHGIECLERAVLLDPQFALAHVCLSRGYALLAVFGAARPSTVSGAARKAAERALELRPDLAEAHAQLGHIKATFDLDFAGATASLRTALGIDAKCRQAHHNMSLVLLGYGRFDEALAHLRHAQAQEPLAANVNANIGMTHYFAGRYHEAIAQLEATLELDEDFAHARSFLGRCWLRLGKFDHAMAEFDRRKSGCVMSHADIPMTLALSGRREDARQALSSLLEKARESYVSPYEIGMVHASMGDETAALSALERAVSETAAPVSFLNIDPAFFSLRSDDRFLTLLQRLKIA